MAVWGDQRGARATAKDECCPLGLGCGVRIRPWKAFGRGWEAFA